MSIASIQENNWVFVFILYPYSLLNSLIGCRHFFFFLFWLNSSRFSIWTVISSTNRDDGFISAVLVCLFYFLLWPLVLAGTWSTWLSESAKNGQHHLFLILGTALLRSSTSKRMVSCRCFLQTSCPSLYGYGWDHGLFSGVGWCRAVII